MANGRWRHLVVLVVLGPTLVVPVPKWHHHAEADAGRPRHADCGLCDLALSVDCVPIDAPPLDLPLIAAAAPGWPTPAPPAAPDLDPLARGPPIVTH